jgi:hypothetical protein
VCPCCLCCLSKLRVAEPAAGREGAARCTLQVCVVLGTQWGDEGKGKLVDILAQEYEIVARAQVRARWSPLLCVPWLAKTPVS